jgi:hypothetical protein
MVSGIFTSSENFISNPNNQMNDLTLWNILHSDMTWTIVTCISFYGLGCLMGYDCGWSGHRNYMRKIMKNLCEVKEKDE